MRVRACSLGLACFLGGVGCGSETSPVEGAAAGSSSGASAIGGMPLGGAQSAAGSSSAGAQGGALPGGGSGGTSAGGASGGAGGAAGSGAGSGGGPTMLSGTPVVFIGGNGNNYPLRVYDLNKTTGALTQRGGDFDAGSSPMYLTLDPTRTHLYAANETGGQAGGITALSINPDGSLTQLNHVQSSGDDKSFTHLTLDPSGKFVLGASYNGGTVSVFPINPDGSMGAEVDNVAFGNDAKAHCVALDPTGKYVFIPTLGNNRVEQLSLSATGILSASTPPNVASAPGAGPRHIAIHPSGKLAFVINELASSVTPYQLSAAGLLTAGTTLSSLPIGFNGGNSGAHIELSPDGRFVYASNRGHNSIVVFSADQTTGALTLVEHEPTRGNTPRDFDVDPNGELLVVANQGNALLTVYKIEADGGLTPLGEPVAGPPNPTAVQIHYLP